MAEQQVRVVVGVDTSAESIAALDWALRAAAAFEGSVIVVHAVGLLEEGGYRPRPDVVAIVDDACSRAAWPARCDDGGLRGRTGGRCRRSCGRARGRRPDRRRTTRPRGGATAARIGE